VKNTPLLECKGLNCGYGDMQVLYEVNLTVKEGEAVVVFGSNGSGKSTLMKVISGVLKPWGGTIRLSNRDITNLRPYERVKMGHILRQRHEKSLSEYERGGKPYFGGIYKKREGKRDA
jgi:ABC-type branched-subunit amino acid transport system ATPase component